MIELFNKLSGEKLGTLSEAQFDFLLDFLEDDYAEEAELVIDATAIEQLRRLGAPEELATMLKQALGKLRSLAFVYHIVEEPDVDNVEE